MKKLLILISLITGVEGIAQRYLTEVFLELDSTIAGVYGTALDYQSSNQDLLFDFYAPSNDTLMERPLIIYIHGGGFTSGSRTLFSIQEMCRRMARKGYAVANIDYRLDPTFELYNSTSDRRAMTDAMHDAKQAIRYFKANSSTYGIDSALVFIGGESAGAATAMMASFVDNQSEMATYPMANPNNPIGSNTNPEVGNGVKATLCLCGLILDTLAMESPSDPAILWTHGTNDNFIPISLAFQIVLRAENIGLNYTAKVYQDGVHCPWYLGNPEWETYLDSTLMDITNFLYPFVSANTTGIGESHQESNITLFPNPFQSQLNIDFGNYNEPLATISVFDALGKEVYQKTHMHSVEKLRINLAHLEPGTYFLLLEDKVYQLLKEQK